MDLTLAVNLKNLALTQYVNYNFNSYSEINGVKIGFNESGVFELDKVGDDDGVDIAAFAELVRSDWGSPSLKRLRKIYVGYEAEGRLKLTFKTDEGREEVYNLEPTLSLEKQGSSSTEGRRSQKGRYWEVKVENTKGCDFSLDAIDITPVVLTNKPKGS